MAVSTWVGCWLGMAINGLQLNSFGCTLVSNFRSLLHIYFWEGFIPSLLLGILWLAVSFNLFPNYVLACSFPIILCTFFLLICVHNWLLGIFFVFCSSMFEKAGVPFYFFAYSMTGSFLLCFYLFPYYIQYSFPIKLGKCTFPFLCFYIINAFSSPICLLLSHNSFTIPLLFSAPSLLFKCIKFATTYNVFSFNSFSFVLLSFSFFFRLLGLSCYENLIAFVVSSLFS